MSGFKALVIDNINGVRSVGFKTLEEDQLMDGDVTFQVTHSTLNYKDGLSITGKGKIARRFPMIPGADSAGIVVKSEHVCFKPGDRVALNGWGASETHFGGFAELARVPGNWLTHIPDAFTNAEAMAIGTAGLTAMYSLMALEHHGLTPDRGTAIVTGACGGVGSMAVTLLAKHGWHVIAVTGRTEEAAYLKHLGASEIMDRQELDQPLKPLDKEKWVAGIDCLGSKTLAKLLSHTHRNGAIAACGLAQGIDLSANIAPFILRGIALLGIDSVYCPSVMREKAWSRLAQSLDRQALQHMTSTIALEDVVQAAQNIIEGKVKGRTVVKII